MGNNFKKYLEIGIRNTFGDTGSNFKREEFPAKKEKLLTQLKDEIDRSGVGSIISHLALMENDPKALELLELLQEMELM